jgi:hypothetical protein
MNGNANVKANTNIANSNMTNGEPLDLNSATKEQLDALPGVGQAYSQKIISNRPYRERQTFKEKVVPKPPTNKSKTASSPDKRQIRSAAIKKSGFVREERSRFCFVKQGLLHAHAAAHTAHSAAAHALRRSVVFGKFRDHRFGGEH